MISFRNLWKSCSTIASPANVKNHCESVEVLTLCDSEWSAVDKNYLQAKQFESPLFAWRAVHKNMRTLIDSGLRFEMSDFSFMCFISDSADYIQGLMQMRRKWKIAIISKQMPRLLMQIRHITSDKKNGILTTFILKYVFLLICDKRGTLKEGIFSQCSKIYRLPATHQHNPETLTSATVSFVGKYEEPVCMYCMFVWLAGDCRHPEKVVVYITWSYQRVIPTGNVFERITFRRIFPCTVYSTVRASRRSSMSVT